jgi:hypothetical protein
VRSFKGKRRAAKEMDAEIAKYLNITGTAAAIDEMRKYEAVDLNE